MAARASPPLRCSSPFRSPVGTFNRYVVFDAAVSGASVPIWSDYQPDVLARLG